MFFYGKIHYKSPFSIAMLNYRRVVGQHLKKNCRSTSHRDKIRERLKVSAPSRKNTIFHGVGASCTSIVLFLVGHIYIQIYIMSRQSDMHPSITISHPPHLLGFGQFDPGNAFSSPLAHDLFQDVVGMPRRHVFPGAQCQVGNLAGAWHAWQQGHSFALSS